MMSAGSRFARTASQPSRADSRCGRGSFGTSAKTGGCGDCIKQIPRSDRRVWREVVASPVLTPTKPSLHSLALDELAAHLKEHGEPAYRAKQIADWLYKKRVSSPAEMTDLPQPLRAHLAEQFNFQTADVVRILGSNDTTQKFLFRLRDANLIESVLIPASPALYGQTS